jgi:hypothetical protein
MIELACGAGSVPCKQQHTTRMEIELARPTIQARTRFFGLPPRVRCSVFWSPFSPWQFFPDDPQPTQPRITRVERNLRFTRGTCRAVASREGGSAVQQFFKFL